MENEKYSVSYFKKSIGRFLARSHGVSGEPPHRFKIREALQEEVIFNGPLDIDYQDVDHSFLKQNGLCKICITENPASHEMNTKTMDNACRLIQDNKDDVFILMNHIHAVAASYDRHNNALWVIDSTDLVHSDHSRGNLKTFCHHLEKKNMSVLYLPVFSKPSPGAGGKPSVKAVTLQADNISCPIISTKILRRFDKKDPDTQETYGALSFADPDRKLCYPHPMILAFSQSEKFLEQYCEKFIQAMPRQHLKKFIVNNKSQLKEKIKKDLEDYRQNHYAKDRILYYALKAEYMSYADEGYAKDFVDGLEDVVKRIKK